LVIRISQATHWEAAGETDVGDEVPAPEDDGETEEGDVSFTAAESKRIRLPMEVPLLNV
jgi:hypothetical protein